MVEPQNQFPRQKLKNIAMLQSVMPKDPCHLGRGLWVHEIEFFCRDVTNGRCVAKAAKVSVVFYLDEW